MNKKKLFTFGALAVLGIVVAAVNLVIGIFLIKILWSTIAEALFSKLVASGQIATSMSWKETVPLMNMALLVFIISGLGLRANCLATAPLGSGY